MNYDIIGDIHGHADKLTALLRKLGYRPHAGAWRHPDRSALFVGDFIDRGPGQLDTLGIVRGMIDAGSAQAVMGNHEFNAIAWSMPDPESTGEHLRRRSASKHRQHKAFLDAAGSDSDVHREIVDWFLTLPLWLDLPEVRVVHACWHPARMAEIEPLLKPGRRLDPDLIVAASRRDSMEYHVIETLTKGPEVRLPPAFEFLDEHGSPRNAARIKWWDGAATTYRDGAIVDPGSTGELPETLLPGEAPIGYDGSKPVFFGHYWFGGTPAPLSDRVACVDYSAGKSGSLVAYRWEGEKALHAGGFVSA